MREVERRGLALWVATVAIVTFACLPHSAHAGIHHITVTDDLRIVSRMETFGFFAGGTIDISAENFKVGDAAPTAGSRIAFLIKHVDSDASAYTDDSEAQCRSVEEGENGDFYIPISSTKFQTKRQISKGAEGYYSILFLNCAEVRKPVTFELQLELYNPGPNYLPAGFTPLPTIYFLFFVVFFIVLVVWVMSFMRGEGKKVYRIHHLMTVLIALKVLSLFFKAIEFHFKKTTGHPGAWAIAYYIFAALKGIMTFVVIALIGTGWAFVKPYLSEKDKKIFIIVIPLQIISNVAMVIIEETAPGSQGWFTWKEIFRLVDIICCGAILVPIIWSIKHLRDAAQIDGKAKKNMEKLKLFRQFYLLVVTYIYFTRIIVYLLDATLSFKYVWLGELFTEFATLVFWCITGYKFRPVAANPYLEVSDDEDGDEEGHPDDDGDVIAMQDLSQAVGSSNMTGGGGSTSVSSAGGGGETSVAGSGDSLSKSDPRIN